MQALPLMWTARRGNSIPGGLPCVVAHRSGAGEAPENTVAAARHCHAIGCAVAQVEVLLAQDGVPVVLQNPSLKRLTGIEKSVKDFGADALPPLLPLIPWYFPGTGRPPVDTRMFPADGQRIATLRAFLAEAKKGDMPCFLEPFEAGKETVHRMAEEVRAIGMEEQVVVGSPFSSVVQADCREALPRAQVLLTLWDSLKYGLLYRIGLLRLFTIPPGSVLNSMMVGKEGFRVLKHLPFTARMGFRALSTLMGWLVWNPAFLAHLRERAVPSVAFVLNSEEDWDEACALGVTAIATDFPERCIRHLERKACSTST